MPATRKDTIPLIIAVCVFLVFAGFLVWPFFSPLFIAIVLAVLLHGIFLKIKRSIPSESLAAFVTTVLVLLIILIPLAAFGYQIAHEAQGLYESIRDKADSVLLDTVLARVNNFITFWFPGLNLDKAEVMTKLELLLGWIVNHFSSIFTSASSLIANFFLMLLAFFYLVRDGEKILKHAMEISPLSSSSELHIINRIASAMNSVVRGSLITAFTQGIIATIGFFIFGVPNAVLWGSVTFLAAFVPNIGTSLVLVPVAIFLFITSTQSNTIGFVIWGVLAVGFVDNLLGPRIIGRGMRIHPLISLFSVLGGIIAFGPIGLLVGPVSASLLVALLELRHNHTSDAKV